ncbi:glycosyltransferase family 39 protein [Streptomyces lydicus]|uniref:glycosyltransferase family 39 protein n=1 Tax=Streptomyces lydicus TaxID=47763 RepID=UPI0036EC895D
MLNQVDIVHGFYYLLMHVVFEIFGDSLWTLRMPSVLAMTAAAALTATLGARLAGSVTGLASGLVFALSPAAQFYAQEGRSYALVTSCAAGATLLLVAALEGSRPLRWVGYAGLILCAGLLNWFSLLILLAHAATLVLVRPCRPHVLCWVAAASAAAGGTLPLIWVSRTQIYQVSWIRPLTPSVVLVVMLFLCAGAACGKVPHRGARRIRLAALAVPLFVVPPFVLMMVSLVKPVFLTRYVLYAQVGLALLLGLALGAGAQWLVARKAPRPGSRRDDRARLLLIAAAVSAFVLLLPLEWDLRQPGSRADDVLTAANEVSHLARPGDAVLFLPAARRDTLLVSPATFTGLRDLALVTSPVPDGTLKGAEASPCMIRAMMAATARIVVVSDVDDARVTSVRDRAKQAMLRSQFVVLVQREHNGRRVTVYVRHSRDGAAGQRTVSPQRSCVKDEGEERLDWHGRHRPRLR